MPWLGPNVGIREAEYSLNLTIFRAPDLFDLTRVHCLWFLSLCDFLKQNFEKQKKVPHAAPTI